MSLSIQESWSQVKTWISNHCPELLAALHSGAPEEEIEKAERAMGVRLPEPVKACYRIHNGQKPGSPGLLDVSEFLSLERMVEDWSIWKELLDAGDFQGDTSAPPRQVRNDWWHPGWVPFTADGSGNSLCIDLAPSPDGLSGQIIEMWHDDDSRPLVAASFHAWFTAWAERVIAGQYVLSDEYGGLILRNEL